MTLYQVTLKNICAGVITNEFGNIIEAAPILRKFFLKKHIKKLAEWVTMNGGRMKIVSSWERE
jgi:hypothetical protein